MLITWRDLPCGDPVILLVFDKGRWPAHNSGTVGATIQSLHSPSPQCWNQWLSSQQILLLIFFYDQVSSSRKPGPLLSLDAATDAVSGGGHPSPTLQLVSEDAIRRRWVPTEDELDRSWLLSSAVTQFLICNWRILRLSPELKKKWQLGDRFSYTQQGNDLWSLRPAESNWVIWPKKLVYHGLEPALKNPRIGHFVV